MDASLRCASFSMTCCVIPNTLFCHSERQRGIHLWMLHFVQHDRLMSFRTLSFVIPSVSEESSTWMLRFAQHDRSGKCGCFASFSMTDRCHSEHSLLSFRTPVRNPLMDASLRCAPFSMTCCVIPNAFSLSFQMFFSLLFRVLFSVIPSASEESSAMWMLRFAQHG